MEKISEASRVSFLRAFSKALLYFGWIGIN
jgi:hypothetical protein